ncbi:MAG: phosphoribosylanthranilate isomerase [Planctomycetota bacterium]
MQESSPSVFRTKICGVTRLGDARSAYAAGADAIGLNFFAGSKRCIDDATAGAIANDLRGKLSLVGVFVNASAEEITRVASRLRLDAVQLHGDEPPALFAELAPLHATGVAAIRARRLDANGLPAVAADLAACRDAGLAPDAVLIDSAVPGEYGGAGVTLDWASLPPDAVTSLGTPVLLAGGLTPANVQQAIFATQPHGVDVASGVESAPGVKDPQLVQQFVAQAHAALRA